MLDCLAVNLILNYQRKVKDLKNTIRNTKNTILHHCKDPLLYLKYIRKGADPMKIILKLLALPILLLVKILCILGNLLTNVFSYVIGLLLLVIGGCAIYCIVKALWTSLAILVGMGLAAFLMIFLLVWAVVKLESISSSLGTFIRS